MREGIVAIKYNDGSKLQNQQLMELKRETLFPKERETVDLKWKKTVGVTSALGQVLQENM